MSFIDYVKPAVIYDDYGEPSCSVHGPMTAKWRTTVLANGAEVNDFDGYYCPRCEALIKAHDYRELYPDVKRIEEDAKLLEVKLRCSAPPSDFTRKRKEAWWSNTCRNILKNGGFGL